MFKISLTKDHPGNGHERCARVVFSHRYNFMQRFIEELEDVTQQKCEESKTYGFWLNLLGT